ncbi:MBOAT, membrane-bound O-acyltransferase family-domain-containing protein [Schizothecium vesticola]|uniref:MBOAT, membrane-bound O-acyltransferase family-domain-containing protein n=1 Tax=Schizothecium vesticola TaxID=314040 RepID=A0AA40EP32_9PEZI|nr:MBOAT, membrane-bound O-acyltransferase family-domain-containing protein [Schizothecium vesticola]
MVFIAGVIATPLYREWGWSQTVFFVMHGLVMVMKQHSYAWYNGYLSTVEGRRRGVMGRLKELERVGGTRSSTGQRRKSVKKFEADTVGFEEPLDEDQAQVLECMLRWEADALTDELKGKATSAARAYPHNLTWGNFYEFIGLPTLVYELEYPRCDGVDWWYAAEKAAACFGVLFVMVLVSQAFIYPVVMDTVRWKDEGMPLSERFAHFPHMLLRLVFPFMMEYLLAWYLIWETILNFAAEVTRFADRRFYDAWWNSVSWDQFARDWNRPVHNFLRRHVYHSSISAMNVDKHTATLMTFFLSACAHELVMWCIFKKLRGYLLLLQMFQLPLVKLSRTRWLRDKAALGNVMFWFGIFTGPSILCSLYLIL